MDTPFALIETLQRKSLWIMLSSAVAEERRETGEGGGGRAGRKGGGRGGAEFECK